MPIFKIEVTRIGYATRVIEVEAADRREGERIALDTAASHEFTEHDADYELTHGSCAEPDNHHPKRQEGCASCPNPI